MYKCVNRLVWRPLLGTRSVMEILVRPTNRLRRWTVASAQAHVEGSLGPWMNQVIWIVGQHWAHKGSWPISIGGTDNGLDRQYNIGTIEAIGNLDPYTNQLRRSPKYGIDQRIRPIVLHVADNQVAVMLYRMLSSINVVAWRRHYVHNYSKLRMVHRNNILVLIILMAPIDNNRLEHVSIVQGPSMLRQSHHNQAPRVKLLDRVDPIFVYDNDG